MSKIKGEWPVQMAKENKIKLLNYLIEIDDVMKLRYKLT